MAILAIAEENSLKLEIKEVSEEDSKAPEYLEINPLGKIPSFIGSNNGYASILQWMSYCNQEISDNLGSWTRALLGLEPYNKKAVSAHEQATLKAISALEKHLLLNTFLVGERISLADIFCTSLLYYGFQHVFDEAWRKAYPNVTRWYETIHNQPIYSKIAGRPSFIAKAIGHKPTEKGTAPKKEPTPKAPKAVTKPKTVEANDEAEQATPNHPLDALPKPVLVLDDWKRKYSNNDARKEALPWFWENYKPEEYSLWRVDYNHNEELTQIFMSNNLIGGFFNRLEASRKYIFGCASVYGTSNESVIVGAFLVRGQEARPAFGVAPDHESFGFTKLDLGKEEHKEFIASQWAWDKPMVIKGKEYPFAGGKVFK
ncbi:MAG: hypothetical protein M1840_004851 [Geoglossum simile]|nr:MAG: hypothetical protein M1840_004851 [Geoglossum simile]